MKQLIAQRGDYQQIETLPSATLRGRVTNASGKPVAGRAFQSPTDQSSPIGKAALASRTDADGYYTINDAAPFDEAEYKKQLAAQEQQTKEDAARGTQSFRRFVSQPILSVVHPDYAVKQTSIAKSPGTQDVQLEPAAALEGRRGSRRFG